MEIIWSIKEKTGGTWHMVPLSSLAGKTLQQFFREANGKEIVAEFIIGGEHCYFCGTTHWREQMKKKGKTCTFDQAAKLIQDKNPDLLLEIFPIMKDISDIFPGVVVETSAAHQPIGPQEQGGLFV